MSKSNGIVTPEYLREFFSYDPESGIVTRKKQSCKFKKDLGFIVGTRTKEDYLLICVLGRVYPLHRAIMAITNGEWPSAEMDVDHINGIRDDNRILNLRIVSRQHNLQNRRQCQPKNISGLLGVSSLNGGRYRARIYIDKKCISIGTFDTKESAHEEYLKAKRQLHAGCTI